MFAMSYIGRCVDYECFMGKMIEVDVNDEAIIKIPTLTPMCIEDPDCDK